MFFCVNRRSCSMPSLNVHGTKKKVVGFVDQVSPDRYIIVHVTQLVSQSSPNSDSSEGGSKQKERNIFQTETHTERENI